MAPLFGDMAQGAAQGTLFYSQKLFPKFKAAHVVTVGEFRESPRHKGCLAHCRPPTALSVALLILSFRMMLAVENLGQGLLLVCRPW